MIALFVYCNAFYRIARAEGPGGMTKDMIFNSIRASIRGDGDDEEEELPDEVGVAVDDVSFTTYSPPKLTIGKPHPDPVVEATSLAAVLPPDVTYR